MLMRNFRHTAFTSPFMPTKREHVTTQVSLESHLKEGMCVYCVFNSGIT